jgi:hypothetical protein
MSVAVRAAVMALRVSGSWGRRGSWCFAGRWCG